MQQRCDLLSHYFGQLLRSAPMYATSNTCCDLAQAQIMFAKMHLSHLLVVVVIDQE